MIKTPKARNFVRRWVDSTIFVDGTTTTSHRVTNRTANNVSLYEFILAYLSRESMCDNYTGSIISDSEVYIPASAFLTSATSSRTNNRNIDLYAAINTVVADGDICDLPFSINADTYTVDFLKTLYLDLRLDSTEISKPFLARPQNIRRKNPNDAISMKTIIDNYAKDILDLENLPTITLDIAIVDPNDITVDSVGLKSDGITPMGAGDGLFMSVLIDGVTTPLYEGNPIPWGTEVTIEDRSFFGTKGITNINLNYNYFFFGTDGAFINPITFIVKPIENLGLFSERRGIVDSDILPLF